MSRSRIWMTLAVIGALAAGATTVFLIGSNNREADRQAVLRYEAAVLAEVREMSVIAGSLAEMTEAFERGRLAAAAFAKQARTWEQTLSSVASRVDGVEVPAPFGAGERLFAPAARTYVRAAGLAARAAECAATRSTDPTCVTIGQAKNVAAQALAQFRSAAAALDRTRERLGLGPSPNFGDPPRQ